MASDEKKPTLGSWEKPVESKNVPLTNPNNIQSVYANDFGIGFTLTDVRLIFTELGADVVTTPSKVLKANVIIPLAGAEALARGILAQLELHKNNIQALQASQNAKKSTKSV